MKYERFEDLPVCRHSGTDLESAVQIFLEFLIGFESLNIALN